MNQTLVFLMLASVVCGQAFYTCLQEGKSAYSYMEKVLQRSTIDEIVDGMFDGINLIPDVLRKCGDQGLAEKFRKEVPPVCVSELDKAMKMLIKISNDQDQWKMSKDALMLETFFETKIKRHCPFMKDVNAQEIQKGGVCLESSYQLSLIFQQMIEEYKAGSKQKAYQDLDNFLSALPDTLEACGQSHLADEVRKYLPMNCVHALQSFLQELQQLEHHYMHWEWVAEHGKEIMSSLNNVRKQCPYFHK